MSKNKTKNRNRKKGKSRIGVLIFILIVILVGFLIYKNYQTKSERIASIDTLQIGVYNPFINEQNPAAPGGKKESPSKNKNSTLPDEPEFPNACNHDNGKKAQPGCECRRILVECSNNKCVRVIPEKDHPKMGEMTCEQVDSAGLCSDAFTGGDTGIYCVGKPIIYLYPEVPTFINVEIETTGSIFISDPLYPDKGWQNVLAYPNGNLIYQGKSYRELFYETNVVDFQKPTSGINIRIEEIEEKLNSILTLNGLNEFEKKEFIDYWVPKLKALNSPYIQFSLITGKAKDEIDKVIISPKPDVLIEILAYFKPLDKPFQGKKLELPASPPERTGFTTVEWGGILDDKEN